ncbi:hypothetical protein ANOM_009991 [Aspergillus nomiae NRRL 13137]|uniref:Clr5 domain-containing protein n=1 Tax=Aspergillus nomiae NRRL (strain ATCC 15546 / NRRL 13137 / CBS 260.88 / M93) TaxID=1509407 RepID=A0A0L1IPV1_ASPN3|nr:uncharacterized protein ANOM_009991 [Aspergillus nomiae NRRL 13137]KNG81499.1 hypothetical protein ANOM_009991 [Aspergillus nomiae NRRL 13137]
MDRSRATIKLLNDRRWEIIRLYLIEGRMLPEIQRYLQQGQRQLGFEPQLSIWHLKRLLKEHGIIKNLRGEALFIKDHLGLALTTWDCLVFANDFLVDNRHVEQSCQRRQGCLRHPEKIHNKFLTFMHLPFEFRALSQPDTFKSFQQLLFYTRVHFDSSFEAGRWAPDSRGLYARSATLKADLAVLSNMHNKISHALSQFKAKNPERAQRMMQNTFEYHKAIVQNYHHRQFSDILAILLLIQRAGLTHGEAMIRNLVTLARETLPQTDPRKSMFESLRDLPLDSTGHLYLAFDTYCRYLWRSKTGPHNFKTYYSYNQASFPRADPVGFFDFFKEKDAVDITYILGKVDEELGEYSHEAFTLWHTAMRSLGQEQRYTEIESLARYLCMRVYRLGNEFDYSEERQLNLDAMLSFYLLGNALEAQGYLYQAIVAYENSVEIRCRNAPNNGWDAGKAASLRRVKEIATRLGIFLASDYISMEDSLYSGV